MQWVEIHGRRRKRGSFFRRFFCCVLFPHQFFLLLGGSGVHQGSLAVKLHLNTKLVPTTSGLKTRVLGIMEMRCVHNTWRCQLFSLFSWCAYYSIIAPPQPVSSAPWSTGARVQTLWAPCQVNIDHLSLCHTCFLSSHCWTMVLLN